MSGSASIDTVLRQAVEADEVPGVVALAGDRSGALYQGAFGRRSLAAPDPMTVDSVFWIASMTKAITTTAAMQQVEAGALSLDEPLGRILPQLAEPQVLEGFNESGAPRLRPARRPVTLRLLLTHTSGFSYDIWNAGIGRYMEARGLPGIITCRLDALRTPLIHDPGEAWEYGIGIDWAGKAVEAVTGQSLEAVLRERILEPLGMRDTGFRIGPEQRRRLVGMHARAADGSLAPIPFEVPQEPEFHMGGGGLYGTGPDYLRFMRMVLNRGELDGARILRPETVEEMARNQIGELRVGMMRTALPASSNDAEFFPGMPKGWGLGFLINLEDAPGGGRAAGSLAWAGLGNTYFWIDPKQDRAGVILTQILPFADAKVLDLLTRFERAVYAAR